MDSFTRVAVTQKMRNNGPNGDRFAVSFLFFRQERSAPDNEQNSPSEIFSLKRLKGTESLELLDFRRD